MILSLYLYGYDLWVIYPKLSSQSWQYGYKQVLDSIKSDYEAGKPILFTRKYGRPSIYALFYWKLDPAIIQAMEPLLPQDQGELLALPGIFFDTGTAQNGGVTVLSQENDVYAQREMIPFLDGKPAFYIYDY